MVLFDEHVHSLEVFEVAGDGANDAGLPADVVDLPLQTDGATVAVFADEDLGLAGYQRVKAVDQGRHDMEVLFLQKLLDLNQVVLHLQQQRLVVDGLHLHEFVLGQVLDVAGSQRLEGLVVQIAVPIPVAARHVRLVEELDQVKRILDLDDVQFL